MRSFASRLFRRPSLRALLSAAALLSAPGWAGAADPAFTEVTTEVGLAFSHQRLLDTPGTVMHGGATVGDFDGDGWPDVFLVGGGANPDRLCINHGGAFVDEGESRGFTDLYRGNGVGAGDYDRDGDLDLFVTSFGDLPGVPAAGHHRLYRNDGGLFVEVAEEAGLRFANPRKPDGYSPVFGDYDLDGDLDLWIGGWHPRGSASGQGGAKFEGTRLFQNQGDGTFVDVSVESGIYDDGVRGFSATFVDMDGDRYPEILVAGDFATSRYYVNNGDGTFTGRSQATWANAYNGMGNAVADFDRDGRPDWFVTSIYPGYRGGGPPGNFLYYNVGGHELRVRPEADTVKDGGWGWAATAFDFDHDGWVDIFHTGGWPYPDPVTGEYFDPEQSYLFHNRGDGTFDEVAVAVGLEHYELGRAAGTVDFDRDGDLDVYVSANDGAFRFYRNDLAGDDAHWLQLRLHPGDNPRVAPRGLGTKVRIETPDGQTFQRQLTGHGNYLGGDQQILHFGLGAFDHVPRVTVGWADGSVTVLEYVAADQLLEITAPPGAPAPPRSAPASRP